MVCNIGRRCSVAHDLRVVRKEQDAKDVIFVASLGICGLGAAFKLYDDLNCVSDGPL
jgi:hypothetical protein